MSNPYEQMPTKAFWRPAVAEKNPLHISHLWQPKHELKKNLKIATAGSCFAQHISRALSTRGYEWFNAEPGPHLFDEKTLKDFNYGIFSFRTGNIYTAAALRQWIFWALELEGVPEDVWEKDGRYYDPFRPNIEPRGFASVEELKGSRQITLDAIRRVINETDHFVFTLGLTEGWVHKKNGYVYAMCPGVIAGEFDQDEHGFKNFKYMEVFTALKETFAAIRKMNTNIRFLLTVSPVPLTATASGEHVLTATTYSKSVLRAVAGALASNRNDTDYFPSFEIATSHPFRGFFYEPNMRSVSPNGVNFIMDSFFACLTERFGSQPENSVGHLKRKTEDDNVICEDAMLEAFGRT